MGVEGAESVALVITTGVIEGPTASLPEGIGNVSHVDVTSRVFSTARRYLPIYL